MKARFIYFLAGTIGLIAMVAIAVAALYRDAPGTSGIAKIGGPFELVDQDGRARTDVDFKGELMLVYFGFTFCPDACPTALLAMSQALDLIGPAADKVRPVFVTIDPARDTPPQLRLHAQNFHPRLVSLTGSDDQVARAARAYRVYYAKAKGGEAGDQYLMDHTSIVYLMGRDGRYLTHFSHGTQADKMAEQIRRHL
ncbi:MAG: SCO family protein [Alphaproteobacteria bacterium]|nr:SCO family protein [Alphaproteobacteria bacterium]